jgi:hypothetical protein
MFVAGKEVGDEAGAEASCVFMTTEWVWFRRGDNWRCRVGLLWCSLDRVWRQVSRGDKKKKILLRRGD